MRYFALGHGRVQPEAPIIFQYLHFVMGLGEATSVALIQAIRFPKTLNLQQE
jgi:hypothetical protein